MGLVKVDIASGQVLEDNLHRLWEQPPLGADEAEPARGSGSSRGSCSGAAQQEAVGYRCGAAGSGVSLAERAGEGGQARVAGPSVGRADPAAAQQDEALRRLIKAFRDSRGAKKTSWSEAELYRLAIMVGQQKRNYKQASAHLGRTPRACQFMLTELRKFSKGVRLKLV